MRRYALECLDLTCLVFRFHASSIVLYCLDLSVTRAVVATHASTPPATHEPPPRSPPSSPSRTRALLLADFSAAAKASRRLAARSAALEGAPDVDLTDFFSTPYDDAPVYTPPPAAPPVRTAAVLFLSPKGRRPRRTCLEMRPWCMSMYARTASTSRREEGIHPVLPHRAFHSQNKINVRQRQFCELNSSLSSSSPVSATAGWFGYY